MTSLLPAALILLLVGLLGPAAAIWAVRQRKAMACVAVGVGLALTALIAVGDFYWEQDVNKGADRGWSLVYTLPALVLAALVYSAVLTLLAVRSLPRRVKAQSPGEGRRDEREETYGEDG